MFSWHPSTTCCAPSLEVFIPRKKTMALSTSHGSQLRLTSIMLTHTLAHSTTSSASTHVQMSQNIIIDHDNHKQNASHSLPYFSIFPIARRTDSKHQTTPDSGQGNLAVRALLHSVHEQWHWTIRQFLPASPCHLPAGWRTLRNSCLVEKWTGGDLLRDVRFDYFRTRLHDSGQPSLRASAARNRNVLCWRFEISCNFIFLSSFLHPAAQ